MQTNNLTDPGQKPEGCCAGKVPATSVSAVLSTDTEDAINIIAKDFRMENEKNIPLKSANGKGRIALEKQCAVVKDVDVTQNRSGDLTCVTASNMTTSTIPAAGVKSLDAAGKRGCDASNVIVMSDPAAIISIVSNQLLQTAESLTRVDRNDRTAVAPAAPSAIMPSSDNNSSKQEGKDSTVDSGEIPQPKGLSPSTTADVNQNENQSMLSCDTAAAPKTLSVVTTAAVGNSLSPNLVTTGSSAASRRSSFFAEPSKTTASRMMSQKPSVLSSRIPMSIVSERTKQFERKITGKGAIEMKSRSLDPPYTCGPAVSQASAYDRLVLGSRPLSAGTSGYAVSPLADEDLKPDGSGKVSEISSSDRVWTRHASHDMFDDRGAKTNSFVDDMVLDQRMDQNSMPFCTPVAKTGNIQKLKSFFGETTPKIMEAKGGARCAAEDLVGETSADGVTHESKKDSHAKCDATAAAQKSLTFDPASWALERMARGKKAAAWTLACRSHSSHAPGNHVRHKKSSTEREPSSSPKHKENKTWKGKVAETFKRYGSGAAVSGVEGSQSEEFAGTFGVPLELLPPSLVSEFVPSFVEMCTRVVEEKGLDNQGIYRVPGNTGALNAMIEELNKDPHGLCMDSEKWQDINLVSSMLKMFFRKLPDPLITDDLYEAVITANRTENSERRMLKLKKLIHDLPEHNFETLRFLAQHLNKVASHEEVNKMDAHNLAIVFGPTLVRPQDDTMVVMVRDMADQCRIVESIIVHCDWFFSSWDEDVYVPVDEETEDATPISGMNQELLAKAERLAFPRLPRDVRCREFVTSFLQVAHRKIRNQRKSVKDLNRLPTDQTVNSECPAKRFKRSDSRNNGGNLKHYFSERKITARPKSLMRRSFHSRGVLRETPLNLIRYPISTAVENVCGTENAEAGALYRTLSLECLGPIDSQVSHLSAKCENDAETSVEMSRL